MKILCFLQNAWYKNPERIQTMIDLHEHHDSKQGAREFYCKTFLFFGCKTGRVLRQTWSEDLIDATIFEEQSPKLGSYSASKFPPDYDHIRQVIARHSPQHVIALGVQAVSALLIISCQDHNRQWQLHAGPHPAARQSVAPRLRQISETLTPLLSILSTGN